MDKLHSGIDFYLDGNMTKAIKIIEEYVNEGGWDLASAYYHMGLCYSDLGMQPRAGECFIKATEYAPEKSIYHYKLGESYLSLMVYEKAVEELETTVKLNPEHQRAKFLLAKAYFQQGKMDQAILSFTDILNTSTEFADAYFYRGLAKYQNNQEKDAQKDILKAIEINPKYNEARFESAKIYEAQGDYKKADKDCEYIYESGYRSYAFIYFYLSVLKKLKKKKVFDSVFDEAIALFPNNQELENLK